MTHICTSKRNCNFCKAERTRKYRAEGRYRDVEHARYEKFKGSLMCIAISVVNREVRAGRLAKATKFSCADCNCPAEVYDHRDYLRPLDVTPVCRTCNRRRGPGKNVGLRPERLITNLEASGSDKCSTLFFVEQ